MISTEQIKELLEKLISGRISREEEEELFDLVNNQDIDDKIIAWLYMRWDGSPKRSIGFHSDRIYEKIRTHLNFPAKSSKEERAFVNYVIEKQNTSNPRTLQRLLKYVAVFVIASVSSYFLAKHNGFGEKFTEGNYTEVRAENGSKSAIILPDSTNIKLNSGSYLRYPTDFTGMNRKVYFEGEAFFKVKPGHPYPFYVNTGNISIRVTGTEFNVKSFPDDQYIETTLISGSIIIEELDQEKKIKNQVVLNPNQLAVYNKNTNILEITNLVVEEEIVEEIIPKQAVLVTADVPIVKSPEITTAWTDDNLVIYNERFDEFLIRLERWYNVDIEIVDEDLKEFRYHATFKNETIEEALAALQAASTGTPAYFKYHITNDQIAITK
jgi:ferric-dicitrate binding protein FerR (iron transport regulator)